MTPGVGVGKKQSHCWVSTNSSTKRPRFKSGYFGGESFMIAWGCEHV